MKQLGYERMGSHGRCDFDQLREAVADATIGDRKSGAPFSPHFYRGHQTVPGINFNSLDRIVTAFVDAEVQRQTEILRRALAWHGDPQRMATTREEWQQVIDEAIVWVKANPEPDRPSFSSFAAGGPPRTAADLIEVIGQWLGRDCNWGDFEKALDAIISPDEVSTVVVAIKHPCPSSPDGKHQVDCTMESGPNNCFHCEKPMPNGDVA